MVVGGGREFVISGVLSLCLQMPTIVFLALIIGCTAFSLWPPGRRRLGGHGASIVTMIGILGTFWGVIVGFIHFNEADIQTSLPELISGLRSAFIASAFGVLCAIIIKAWQALSSSQNSSRQPSFEAMLESIDAIRFGLIGEGDSTLISQLTLMRSNLNDRLDKIVKSQETFLTEMAKSNSEALIDALQDVMRDFNSKINEQFGDNFKQLNIAVGKLLEWQIQYRETLEALVKEEKLSAENLTISAKRLSEIIDKIEAFQLISQELERILAEMSQYGESMNELTRSASSSVSDMAQAVEVFEKNVGHALEGVSLKIEQLAQSTSLNLETASKRVESQVEALDASLEREITKSLESMARQFVSISEKFASDYTPLANKLRDVVRIAEGSR